MSGTVRGQSVADRLERYYINNPGEILTIEDIMRKFSCARSTAIDALKDVRKRNLVAVQTVPAYCGKPREWAT